jgi:hypothetical protein
MLPALPNMSLCTWDSIRCQHILRQPCDRGKFARADGLAGAPVLVVVELPARAVPGGLDRGGELVGLVAGRRRRVRSKNRRHRHRRNRARLQRHGRIPLHPIALTTMNDFAAREPDERVAYVATFLRAAWAGVHDVHPAAVRHRVIQRGRHQHSARDNGWDVPGAAVALPPSSLAVVAPGTARRPVVHDVARGAPEHATVAPGRGRGPVRTDTSRM